MSLSLALILVAIVAMAVSGLPGLFMHPRSAQGQRIAAALSVAGAVAGLTGAIIAMLQRDSMIITLPFTLIGNRPTLAADALSAFFLVPVFLMGGLGSIYGLGYWPQTRHGTNGARLRLFWGFLVTGMSLLVISRNAVIFLLGWEVMALSAFFLITSEDNRPRCREAGWIYLISTHICTLTLFGMFALWRWATGSFALVPAETLGAGVRFGLFALALAGFGMKAGLMPLHFWLPAAHANAPSHVSAILSGVLLKIGVYGLIRMLWLLPNPAPLWGGLILLLAVVSAVLGVVFAIAQHDLKRLLAYHSVENIGIILMGLGLAMLGRSLDRPDWILLGMAGCLLHVWNHSFFKALLFFCAGSVIHSTHTREIDRMGGLAKKMPQTAMLFLVGAVAICGLPPLNGFVSEMFVYLGLLRGFASPGPGGSEVALAAPALAMVGALAVTCFVKVFGAVFLGNPRTAVSEHAHEAPLSMRLPEMILAALCIVIGLAPVLVAPLLDSAIAAWVPAGGPAVASITTLVPLKTLSAAAVALVLLVLLAGLVLARRRQNVGRAGTWDCGYARPTNRMQYTASSLAQMVVSMFAWVLRPKMRTPRVSGAFPRTTEMHSHVNELILDRVLLPAGHSFEGWFLWFHRFQQGLTQHYVLYILITVVVLLGALIPVGALLARLSGL